MSLKVKESNGHVLFFFDRKRKKKEKLTAINHPYRRKSDHKTELDNKIRDCKEKRESKHWNIERKRSTERERQRSILLNFTKSFTRL